MWQPNRAQWIVIWILTCLLILAWPPTEGSSLGVKAIRRLADPRNTLTTLPEPLPMGLDDDGDAVAAHDAQMAEYYRLMASSRTTRWRLELKEITDPLPVSTARQILTGFGILSALIIWRLGGRKRS